MAEQPKRPGRVGTIGGEAAQFAACHLDQDSRTITITVIQRGSRSLERLQRGMSGERITVTLPGDPTPHVTSPGSIDVTTTGTGQQAFHRARLVLHLTDSEDAAAEPTPPTAAANPVSGLAGNDADVAERLRRIEARLDRILAMLERDNNAP